MIGVRRGVCVCVCVWAATFAINQSEYALAFHLYLCLLPHCEIIMHIDSKRPRRVVCIIAADSSNLNDNL